MGCQVKHEFNALSVSYCHSNVPCELVVHKSWKEIKTLLNSPDKMADLSWVQLNEDVARKASAH